MTEKDRSQPSKFSRDIKASEGFQGSKSREELIETSKKRKAEIRARSDERKRKAAEKRSQQQQQEEEQLSEDDDDNDEIGDKK